MRKPQPVPIRAPQRMEVLAIRTHSRDCLTLESIFVHTNWLVHWVADGHEAMLFLEEHPVPVFVCPEGLPDMSWAAFLISARELPDPPKVLVYSDCASPSLGTDVLDAGGYELLYAPLQREQVLRTISLACRTWREETRREAIHAAAMTA